SLCRVFPARVGCALVCLVRVQLPYILSYAGHRFSCERGNGTPEAQKEYKSTRNSGQTLPQQELAFGIHSPSFRKFSDLSFHHKMCVLLNGLPVRFYQNFRCASLDNK